MVVEPGAAPPKSDELSQFDLLDTVAGKEGVPEVDVVEVSQKQHAADEDPLNGLIIGGGITSSYPS